MKLEIWERCPTSHRRFWGAFCLARSLMRVIMRICHKEKILIASGESLGHPSEGITLSMREAACKHKVFFESLSTSITCKD